MSTQDKIHSPKGKFAYGKSSVELWHLKATTHELLVAAFTGCTCTGRNQADTHFGNCWVGKGFTASLCTCREMENPGGKSRETAGHFSCQNSTAEFSSQSSQTPPRIQPSLKGFLQKTQIF